MLGCRARASVSGVEREPGETTTRLTPDRTSVSATTLAHKAFTFRKSSDIGEVIEARLASETGPARQCQK
jgi:hypothetical protein